jgi:Ca2+-binding RTX toxin-like protein
MNVGGLPATYNDSFFFLNLFKGGDGWAAVAANGAITRPDIDGAGFDAQGYPTSMTIGGVAAQEIISNVFYTRVLPAGQYILEWTGEGTVEAYQNSTVIGPNKLLINYAADYTDVVNGQTVPRDDGITVRILSTDPSNTGNYVRDIKLYKTENADLIAAGEKFDPDYIQAIDDFRTLRTHGWQETNFSILKDWNSDVQSADQAFWGYEKKGAPFELLVEISNEANADLWLTIPHMATDEFMRKAAEYIKANLEPGLRVYVEYSNEYWTDGFDQKAYMIQKGQELLGNAPNAAGQYYGIRAAEMATIFYDVFGTESARLFPTLTVNHNFFASGEAERVLTAPDYVATGGKAPIEAGFKHFATDGYFFWYTPNADTENLISSWLKDSDGGFGRARDYLIQQINADFDKSWAAGRLLADKHNLSFGVYEGGSLLINTTDGVNADPAITDFNHRFSLSKEMAQVYDVAIAAWKKHGSEAFAWFADVGRPFYGGDYSLWKNPGFVPDPRTLEIINDNATGTPLSSGDARPGSFFDNGLYDSGTSGADAMSGTALEDRLYGLTGNDMLKGQAGADRLFGGAGDDNIYGQAGNDTIFGGAGTDAIRGGDGDDVINGDADNDRWLAGEAGNDTVNGGDGGDRIDGGDGNDRLNGEAGRDYVTGGSGADVIYGGNETGAGDIWLAGDAGIDAIYGEDGNDRIDGGTEGDFLYGGNGQDTITGAAGDDYIEGGAGTDGLYGGAGLDIFDCNAGFGTDNIYDFADDVDTIQIDPIFGLTVAQVLAAASIFGSHAYINLGGGNGMIVLNWISSGHTIAQLGDDILIA